MKLAAQRDAYLKADAEGRMKLLAKTYGLAAHQLWKHKQSGKWIINHAGIQSIAAQEGIIVSYAPVSMSQEFVVIEATPHINGEVGQSTFGEASPKNTQQTYPVAMAEKRAFDRAVLIAVLREVGGYGADFYGEDEADDFKASAPRAATTQPAAEPPASIPLSAMKTIDAANSLEDLTMACGALKDQARVQGWLHLLNEFYQQRKRTFDEMTEEVFGEGAAS